MTNGELGVLCFTAASIGVVHTLLGPDHTLPFIAISRARGWSLRRTLAVTLVCGVGHVLGSVAIGLIGIACGLAVFELEQIEGFRGGLAGWFLLAFGLTYLAWGLHRAIRCRPHTHVHAHADGTVHAHEHVHRSDHSHVHGGDEASPAEGRALFPTTWILFVLFVFGPCELLIPLLMYPAARGGAWAVALVTLVFGLTTLATMAVTVVVGRAVAAALPDSGLARYGHAVAGLVVAACGAAVSLGW